jgi:hypothetical protein
LTASSSNVQILTPSTDIDVNLPSAGVLKGRVFEIHNESANTITIKSSDGTAISTLKFFQRKIVALQDTPTGLTHW